MSLGLSVYDALVPFAGHIGLHLKTPQFDTLVDLLLETAKAHHPLIIRLPDVSPAMLAGTQGVQFYTIDETMDDSPVMGWQAQELASSDMMARDRFLVSDAPELPLCMVARQAEGGYWVIISTDDPLIDMAKAILSQYMSTPSESIIPPPQSYQTAGRLLAKVMQFFPQDIVASWAIRVLVAPANNRLEIAKQVLGVNFLRWNKQQSGQPGGQSTQTVTTSEGFTLEFESNPDDTDLLARAHLLAGILATMHPAASHSTDDEDDAGVTVKSINMDFAFDELFSDFMEMPIPNNNGDGAHGGHGVGASNGNTTQTTTGIPQQFEDLDADLQRIFAPATPSPKQQQVDIPDAGVELLSYLNREITNLRDRIMDAGLHRALADKQPRDVLDYFISRSGDLVLLLDEMLYLQRMVEQVERDHMLLDPHELLGSLVITYSGEAERRGVELEYDAPFDLPGFEGNAEAINRAMVMLLEQGIDHAAPRGTVTIGARAEGDEIELFVRDSGPQLNDDAIAELFAPGYADDGGTPRLGLAALQPIVSVHGGALRIAHEDGCNHMGMQLSLKHKTTR